MPVAAQELVAIAAEKLRQMVAESATFQAEISAADRDAALTRVFVRNVLGEPTRPHAIVSMGDTLHFRIIGGGDQTYLRPDGSLFLYLARDTNPELYEDQVSAEWDAWNYFSAVLTEIADLAGADDPDSPFTPQESHLGIVDMDVQNWGETKEEDWETLGRWYFAVVRVAWGDGG